MGSHLRTVHRCYLFEEVDADSHELRMTRAATSEVGIQKIEIILSQLWQCNCLLHPHPSNTARLKMTSSSEDLWYREQRVVGSHLNIAYLPF